MEIQIKSIQWLIVKVCNCECGGVYMQELERILEEIIKKSFSVEIREYESETAVLLDDVEEILKRHIPSQLAGGFNIYK